MKFTRIYADFDNLRNLPAKDIRQIGFGRHLITVDNIFSWRIRQSTSNIQIAIAIVAFNWRSWNIQKTEHKHLGTIIVEFLNFIGCQLLKYYSFSFSLVIFAFVVRFQHVLNIKVFPLETLSLNCIFFWLYVCVWVICSSSLNRFHRVYVCDIYITSGTYWLWITHNMKSHRNFHRTFVLDLQRSYFGHVLLPWMWKFDWMNSNRGRA